MNCNQNISGIPLGLYNEVYSIMDDAKIGTTKQLLKLGPNSYGKYLYPSNEFPWVIDLVLAIQKIYSTVLNTHQKINGPSIIHSRMINPFTSFNWTANDKIFDFRSRYGCIFPGKILYLSYQFRLDEDNYAEVPYDFLVLACWLRPLIKNGLSLLLPTRIKDVDEFGINSTLIDCYLHRTDSRNIEIPGTGDGIENFLKTCAISLPKHEKEYNTLMSPILLGSRIEDQIELALERNDDFNRYYNAVTRYLHRSPSNETAINEWIEEINDRCHQLELIHKSKQDDLKRKGFECALGMCFTAAAIVVPMPIEW